MSGSTSGSSSAVVENVPIPPSASYPESSTLRGRKPYRLAACRPEIKTEWLVFSESSIGVAVVNAPFWPYSTWLVAGLFVVHAITAEFAVISVTSTSVMYSGDSSAPPPILRSTKTPNSGNVDSGALHPTGAAIDLPVILT